MKKQVLTEQELKFVHNYVSNGFEGTAAYAKAFDIDTEKDSSKASSGAYRLLKKVVIQDAIDFEEGSYKATAREIGMGRIEVLKELKDIIWGKRVALTKKGDAIEVGEDGKTKIAAINTLVKLTGDFSPERKEVEFSTDKKIDTKNLTDKELKELQAALMNEM